MECKSNPDIFVKKIPDTQILIYADLSQEIFCLYFFCRPKNVLAHKNDEYEAWIIVIAMSPPLLADKGNSGIMAEQRRALRQPIIAKLYASVLQFIWQSYMQACLQFI